MRFPIVLMIVGLALLSFPVSSADSLVGASGQCYKDGVGGQDSASVNSDGTVTTPTVTGTATAAAQLATAGCDYGSTHYGYIEVHVLGNQVCESNKVVFTDGHCPTSPTGP